MGKEESGAEESFERGLLEYPRNSRLRSTLHSRAWRRTAGWP
jgi:hypothetical protein